MIAAPQWRWWKRWYWIRKAKSMKVVEKVVLDKKNNTINDENI